MIVTLGHMPSCGITGMLCVNSTSTAVMLSERLSHTVLHHSAFPSTSPGATFPVPSVQLCGARTQKGSSLGLMPCWHHLEILNTLIFERVFVSKAWGNTGSSRWAESYKCCVCPTFLATRSHTVSAVHHKYNIPVAPQRVEFSDAQSNCKVNVFLVQLNGLRGPGQWYQEAMLLSKTRTWFAWPASTTMCFSQPLSSLSFLSVLPVSEPRVQRMLGECAHVRKWI